MSIETVGVVGGGVMGSDIAFVTARAELQAIVCDVAPEALAHTRARVAGLVRRAVERDQITDEAGAALVARVTTTADDAALSRCDLVIEAVSERIDLKRAIFARLDGLLPAAALIASNTSGLSISELGAATGRPASVVGIHFFNPAAVMRLVELIEGRDTSPATMDAAEAFVRAVGKTPVRVRECPGFLVNRVLVRAMAESYRHAMATGASPAAVDAAVVAAGPAPMGPFALGDLIGLDTMNHIQRDLEVAYGDRFADAGAIAAQVAGDRLGHKNGRGFVTPEPGPDLPGRDAREAARRYYWGALDEALRCHDEHIAARGDIDTAMRLGAGWGTGPLAWADATGLAHVLAVMQELAVATGTRFAPTELLVRSAADLSSLVDDLDLDLDLDPGS